MVPDLVCPKSSGNSLTLSVTKQRGDRIIEGRLTCSVCGTVHKIRSGVANLVPESVVSDDDWQEWKDHLAGFEARREWRNDNPERFSSKITNRSASLQKAFARFVGIQSGTVLDVGCGPGKFSNYLGADVSYFGIDPLPLNETEEVPAVRAIAEYLPFRDGMFTDIVVMAALDHFQDVDAFCREAVRVLVPKGRLHIVQSIHEVRGPVTAIKFAAHEFKDFLETRQTRAESRDAPKHMGEYDRKSLMDKLNEWFEITAEERFSKRWYSPENLFLTLTARS